MNNSKNAESEMPSYEVIIKHIYSTDCSIVWGIRKIPLYRHAGQYTNKKRKPLKVVVGCDFTLFKPKPRGDMNMFFLMMMKNQLQALEVIICVKT